MIIQEVRTKMMNIHVIIQDVRTKIMNIHHVIIQEN